MKIWLDDLRSAPEGYIRCRWPETVIELLKYNPGMVEEVCIDNDLGDKERQGLLVMRWIEEQAIMHGYVPPKVRIQSDNSDAMKDMKGACASILRHTGFDIFEPYVKTGDQNIVS